MKTRKNNKILKYFNISIIFALFAIAMFAKSEEINVAPEGFTALFNGKDLTNWIGYKEWKPMNLNQKAMSFWTVEDGYIKRHGDDGITKDSSIHLAYNKKFTNFTLLLDWKIHKDIPGANSGIMFAPENNYIFQVEILRKKVADIRASGAIRKKLKPEEAVYTKPSASVKPLLDEWNHYEITIKGEYLSVILNGKLVVDKQYLPGTKGAKTFYLQHHKMPGRIDFRNIFIKELD